MESINELIRAIERLCLIPKIFRIDKDMTYSKSKPWMPRSLQKERRASKSEHDKIGVQAMTIDGHEYYAMFKLTLFS
jgi:hypothetical protein